jgi:hypothetical protein
MCERFQASAQLLPEQQKTAINYVLATLCAQIAATFQNLGPTPRNADPCKHALDLMSKTIGCKESVCSWSFQKLELVCKCAQMFAIICAIKKKLQLPTKRNSLRPVKQKTSPCVFCNTPNKLRFFGIFTHKCFRKFMEVNSCRFQQLVCDEKVAEAFQFALKCDSQLDNSKMYYKRDGILNSLSLMVLMAMELERDDSDIASWYEVFFRTNGHLAADLDNGFLNPMIERDIWPGDTFRWLLARGREADVRVVVRTVCFYSRMKEDSSMGLFLKTDLQSAVTQDNVIHVLNQELGYLLFACLQNPNMFKLGQLLSFVPALDLDFFDFRRDKWIGTHALMYSVKVTEMFSRAREKLDKYQETQASVLMQMTFIPNELLKLVVAYLAKVQHTRSYLAKVQHTRCGKIILKTSRED